MKMIEHNTCYNCKFYGSNETELPCSFCKGTALLDSNEYDFKNDIEPLVTSDMVHHPAHYCYSEYEPKDVIRAWGLNFNLGSAVKYIARAGRKDDILQELNKAKQFIEFEIEAIEKERAE